MSDNKLDKRPHWAKRISEYDVVPDDAVYTAEESWQGVQKRMKAQTPKKNRNFYFLGAAVIAVVAAIYLLKKKK